VKAWDGERKTIHSRVQCVPASKFDKTSSLRDSLDNVVGEGLQDRNLSVCEIVLFEKCYLFE
jgi:hypothetical protein